MSPSQVFLRLRNHIKREWKIAFLTCFFLGLLIHMPVLLSDIPNHDGLDSMYFDQNMITSGRWFLTVACGFSSYYTLPWLIGILGLSFLGVAAAALCELLEMRKTWAVVLGSGLLAAFPALASTFAYVYTLALMLAVLAVLFVKRRRLGFLPGAACLAFSMGIYQGYLSFAMILSIFAILMLFAKGADQESAPAGKVPAKGRGKGKGGLLWKKLPEALHYLYMGVLGAGLYFGILQLLLRIQGKELDHYQGIDGLNPGAVSGNGLLAALGDMYRDFAAFTLKGNVLFQNLFSLTAVCVLALSAGAAFLFLIQKKILEESVPFRYNRGGGPGAAVCDEYHIADFPVGELSSADALSVGIVRHRGGGAGERRQPGDEAGSLAGVGGPAVCGGVGVLLQRHGQYRLFQPAETL